MKSQTNYCESIRSLAGLAMSGTGLFLFFGRVAGAAGRLVDVLGHSDDGLGVVSSIMQASSLTMHQVMVYLLALLCPLGLVVVGIFLVSGASTRQIPHADSGSPCVRWA